VTLLENFIKSLLLHNGGRIVTSRQDFGDDPASHGASVRRVGPVYEPIEQSTCNLNRDFGYFAEKKDGKYVVAIYGSHDPDGNAEVTHFETYDTLAELHAAWELDVW
jgi:hypothetical protein